jgi:hypothetical protein
MQQQFESQLPEHFIPRMLTKPTLNPAGGFANAALANRRECQI